MTAKTAIQILGLAAAAWLIAVSWQLLILVFLALTVAAAMLPAVEWAEGRRVPRTFSVAVIYLGALLFFAALAILVVPIAVAQGRQFTDQAPAYYAFLQEWFRRAQAWAGEQHLSFEMPAPTGEGLAGLGKHLLQRTFDVTAGVFGAVFGGIVVFFLASVFVIDGPHIWQGVVTFVPAAWQSTVRELGRPVLNRMGAYVRGQLFSSLCVGALIAIGLLILRVRYAVLIGALAAALNIVPFVGSIAAAVLGILVALNTSLALALSTLVVFAIANLFEGKVLLPFILGRTVGLHPVAVFLALLFGLHLAGLIGALIAIPLIAAISEIVDRLYLRQNRLPS